MTSETLLRRLFWFDAATCIALLLILLVAGGPVETFTGLPRALHLVSVAILVPSGALMIFTARRSPLFRPGALLIVAGNAAWTLASAWVALSGVFPLTGAGIALVLLQGVAVAVLASLEYAALRRATEPASFS